MERSKNKRTPVNPAKAGHGASINNTTEEFLMWLQVERRFAQSSIISYRSRLKCFVRDVGDIPIEEFTMEHTFLMI